MEREESASEPAQYKNVFLYFDPEEVDDDDNDSSIDEDIVAERFQLFQPEADRHFDLLIEETGTKEAAKLLHNYKQSGKLYLRPDQKELDSNITTESKSSKRSINKKEVTTPNKPNTSYTVVNSNSDVEQLLAASEIAPSSPIVKIFFDENENDISPKESPLEKSPYSGRPIFTVLHDTLTAMKDEKSATSKVGHQRIVQRMKKRLEYTKAKNPKNVHNDESVRRAMAVREVVDRQKQIIETSKT